MQFQKISIPTPWKVIRISEGEGGSLKPKFLKESMGLKWNFQRGGGIQIKNLLWEGYRYFLVDREPQLAWPPSISYQPSTSKLCTYQLKSRPPTSNPGTRQGFGLTSLQMSINPHTLGLSTGKTPTQDENF